MSKPRQEDLRKTAFEQSKFDAYRSKFGLFSYPGHIATAEDTYARPLPDHRDETGKVKLREKNFLVAASSTSKNRGCFSTPEYQCDLYQDPPRIYQIEKDRASKMYQTNSSSWKHGGNYSDKKFPYGYTADPVKWTESKRQPDGSVPTGPKGFFTTPAKRGSSTPGITIGKMPEHISDNYENYENWLKNEKLRQKDKRMHGDFTTTVYGKKNFSEDKEVYKPTLQGKAFNTYQYPGVKHEQPFMSTCPSGFTIGKYPNHLSNAAKEVEPQKKFEVPWRHTGILGSVPSRAKEKVLHQDYS